MVCEECKSATKRTFAENGVVHGFGTVRCFDGYFGLTPMYANEESIALFHLRKR